MADGSLVPAGVFGFVQLTGRREDIIICRKRTAHLYRLDRVHLDFLIQSVS